MNRYSALVVILALGLLLAPLAAEAQQAGKVWRIGLFHVGLDHVPPSLDGLREGLKALGYEEGKNIQLDWRNLPDEEAARETAKEFVRHRVDLIVAFENETIRAAKVATSEIPVVFVHAIDPVADGFVKSLSRPGGNLTGLSGVGDFPAKRMEMLKELVPRLRRLLIVIDPGDPATPRQRAEIRRAAEILKLQLVEREAKNQADLERVFGSLKRGHVDGAFVASPNLWIKFSTLLIRLASEKHLPLPMHRKEFAEQGALFSYGANFRAVGQAAARYVDISKCVGRVKSSRVPV